MTRSELIERLSNAYPALPREILVRLVTIVFANIADQLVRGGRVELRGFGSFSIKFRVARVGSNPRSGASVNVAAKRVPAFRASKTLVERLNPTSSEARTGSQAMETLATAAEGD